MDNLSAASAKNRTGSQPAGDELVEDFVGFVALGEPVPDLVGVGVGDAGAGVGAGPCLAASATAFVTEVPVLAAVQLLHALTFACQHLSTMLVLRTLPAQRAGTAQALMSALGFSAPTGLLVWLSGLIYGAAGGLAFLLMAAVGGSALLIVPALARRKAVAMRPSVTSPSEIAG